MPARLPRAGLGLRRAFMEDLMKSPRDRQPDFVEIAPENWMGMGGRHLESLRILSDRFPMACHGLSLSIGGPMPLDMAFLMQLRQFLDTWNIPVYSEHLSYAGDEGHLYDLLPIPFTEEAVSYVANRVIRVQEVLGRRIALENVSYYAAPGAEMSESEFIRAVLTKADCDLLLDVNNIAVNAVNHCYDPSAFLMSMPGERITCLHVAGHLVESDELRIDTHGEPVVDEVWGLLALAYDQFGVLPTVLERDFNFPGVSELLDEVGVIRRLQAGVPP